MSFYDNRMTKQSQENQDIYYAWIADCKRLGKPTPSSMKNYESAVTLFIGKYLPVSILDVEIETIENFVRSPKQKLKVSTKMGRLRYLSNFLNFVSRKYKPRWKWNTEVLKVIARELEDNGESKDSAKPLTVKEMIKLYQFFRDHINERRWLEAYTVFRLMYNCKLDKYQIAKLNCAIFDTTTCELHLDSSSIPVKLDEDLAEIFRVKGLNFLPSNEGDVYKRLIEIEKVFEGERNITQKVIDNTRDLFTIRCPDCGQLIENNPALFGFVRIDIFNLGSFMVCKTCLENYHEDIY